MKKLRVALALSVLCVASASVSPALAQKRKSADLNTPVGKFPLEISSEFLGMAAGKTVVRIRLASPELTKGLSARGVRGFSGQLKGTLLQNGEVAQTFQYPVTASLASGASFSYSFLRAVKPGTYRVRLVFTDPEGGRVVGDGEAEISVPEVSAAFRPEMAPAEASTLPDAEGIVIADEAAGAPAKTSEPLLRILPPAKEAPVGLLRLEAEVQPPIRKVEFYLDEKLLLARTRPPYTVEIDLGNVPRRQTLRAVGYDESGRVIDEDAWAINEGNARLAVRVLPQPDPSEGRVRIKVAVQSISGGVAKKVDLFLDEKKIGSWTSGPYEATVPYAQYSRASYVRATAYGEDGKEANDMRMLRGPSTTVESVRVDVVQLHVSALDKTGHFVKGLEKDDFKIREDGHPEPVSGFEVAENLPLNIGLVVDASGSMEKGMPFVHDAAAELFKSLMRDKDHGFVIEFRDRPRFLQELTSDSQALQRAARDVRAEGATALYDAMVLGLYQFRTLQGRKALIVVTDGDDNRSHVDYDVLLRYARSAGAPIYFIAVNIPLTDFKSRRITKEIAAESGGEVFAIGSAAKMGEVTRRIEEELRSQYVVAYRSTSTKAPGEYRGVEVATKPGITVRTIRGYIPG
ncbi:MAG: VWA domain-containing protein [Acidobacteria bacterium]|nr:VWA domain-containing protein [Acidobacteriota bacterium]MCA1610822.1 VWA domain-containing protein [Acidobacteriota bacterium]